MDPEVKWGDFSGGPVVKTSPSIAGGAGLIPGWGAKIPHASRPKNQNIKQKQHLNKLNKDFKNGPHQKKSLKKKIEVDNFLKSTYLPSETTGIYTHTHTVS